MTHLNREIRLLMLALALALASTSTSAKALAWRSDGDLVDFPKEVRPILESRCIECHGQGPAKPKNGLRLDRPGGIRKGGISGPVIEPGKASESLLIHHVEGVEDASIMPPKGERLSAKQIETLRKWIDQGAHLPEDASFSSSDAGSSSSSSTGNWAFRPLGKVVPPTVAGEHGNWVRNAIDAFVLEKLLANGLKPGVEADRRVLARRVYLDLTGLPPTVEQLDEYLKDGSENAYERLVDRLLASPRYGERWARHWLDVAHYADSHGQDQDRFRPNAWPYRDYLIRSFNEDKPYPKFVREQLAADALYPDDPLVQPATGLLAAGPWDESGLRDINENSLDRQVARYLDRDDIVTSTMTTFAGLTVHCARCHDHKFDPITQADYYALQAVFASTDKAERAYDADPAVARNRRELTAELSRLRGMKDKGQVDLSWLPAPRRANADQLEQTWRSSLGQWLTPEPETWRSKNGASLKALLDRSILAIGPSPEQDSYTVTFSTSQTGLTGLRIEVLPDDVLPSQGPGRAANGNLHLSETRITVYPKGQPEQAVAVKLKKAIADFDQEGWTIAHAIDGNPNTAWGIHPHEGKPHQAAFEFEKPVGFPDGTTFKVEIDQLHGRAHTIGRFRLAVTTASQLSIPNQPTPIAIADALAKPKTARSAAEQNELTRWLLERRCQQKLDALPAPSLVYCGTSQFQADGTFRPATVPRVVHVLRRGEISGPTDEAQPGSVQAVPGVQGRFALTDPNQETQRRIALADWLTDRANPLTWRVIVNRVWHYHFGKGIVDTPNDFGNMGGTPSHPELLDWLAVEFRDSFAGSIKRLHRLILTSNAYRQAVRHDPAAEAKDMDNRWLWKMNRGRLDAETIRDTVLLASGRLNLTMYGLPAKHFLTKPGIHVTPEADYERFDVDSPDSQRRGIYRFIFRTRPDPMLEALDCPDASLSAPVRSTSVGVTQALVLWNNKFLLRHAEHLANLASSASNPGSANPGSANPGSANPGSDSPDWNAQVRFVSQRVLGRDPRDSELALWAAFARQQGLANLNRVLFNSSEFLFID